MIQSREGLVHEDEIRLHGQGPRQCCPLLHAAGKLSAVFKAAYIVTLPAMNGNADVLLGTLRSMGREVIPVTLDFKAFMVYDIAETVTANNNSMAIMIALAVIPALVCFGVGVYINVRRKYL